MTSSGLQTKLDELLRLPAETEWAEFKHNNETLRRSARYLSALSNGAALHGKRGATGVGVEDGTAAVVGTTFRPKRAKDGNEDLESWMLRLWSPRIDFTIHEFDDAADRRAIRGSGSELTPVRFSGEEYIRAGSYKKKLKTFRKRTAPVAGALGAAWGLVRAGRGRLDAGGSRSCRARLRPRAVPAEASSAGGEVDGWDDITFLNKAKVCVGGRVHPDSAPASWKPRPSHLLVPGTPASLGCCAMNRNQEKDYQHFDPAVDPGRRSGARRIRNLTVPLFARAARLFPHEVTQYDPG